MNQSSNIAQPNTFILFYSICLIHIPLGRGCCCAYIENICLKIKVFSSFTRVWTLLKNQTKMLYAFKLTLTQRIFSHRLFYLPYQPMKVAFGSRLQEISSRMSKKWYYTYWKEKEKTPKGELESLRKVNKGWKSWLVVQIHPLLSYLNEIFEHGETC